MVTTSALGTTFEVVLPQGTVCYHDLGSGSTLVFVHGILVNSMLWQGVIPTLAQHFRCITLDLPLGSHGVALSADADVTPGGVAQLIADFMAALDLRDVTLVGNDTGGALCQLVIAHHPDRIGRLVLTNCDAYEAFFPLLISPFQYGARFFGLPFVDLLTWLFRSRSAQRLILALVAHRRLDLAMLDTYFVPARYNRGVRKDLTKFLAAVSKRYTLEAARHFADFKHPVLLLWGKDDLIFSANMARRLQQAFPNAQLEFVADARAFVPVDQPQILAQRIAKFVGTYEHEYRSIQS